MKARSHRAAEEMRESELCTRNLTAKVLWLSRRITQSKLRTLGQQIPRSARNDKRYGTSRGESKVGDDNS